MEITINSILDLSAHKYPHSRAFVFENAQYTYSAFYRRVVQRANCLLSLGIGKGDHVAALSPNAIALLESIFAVWRVGAVLVPLNFRLTPTELSYVLDHSDASVLIFSSRFENVIRQIMAGAGKVKRWLSIGDSCPRDFINFEVATSKQPTEGPAPNVREGDVATILYTAGTTGKPKGVVSTHKNWVWSTINGCLAFDNEAETRLTVYPLFHAAAVLNVLLSVSTGCTLLIFKEFDPKKVLEAVEREKVSRLGNPPTVYNMLLQVPDIEKYDLSSVRHLGSGAETMPNETQNRLLEVFARAGIMGNYGMTEASAFLTSRPEKYTASKPDSIGLPLRFVELRIVDKQGKDVAPGEVGEIVARGPNIMREYYKAPDKTAWALRDGWLHTQDMGRSDEEGFLYIIERKHHMIISGGENIYPKEVEEILYHHPKIVEVAVFGVPDELWGEKVCAAVVLKSGEQMTLEEIVDYCKPYLASFKKPKLVYFLDALPRSPVGKVLRTDLKKRYSQ